jgi:hypothetical protein
MQFAYNPSNLQVSPRKPTAGLTIRVQHKQSQTFQLSEQYRLEPDTFCLRKL